MAVFIGALLQVRCQMKPITAFCQGLLGKRAAVGVFHGEFVDDASRMNYYAGRVYCRAN